MRALAAAGACCLMASVRLSAHCLCHAGASSQEGPRHAFTGAVLWSAPTASATLANPSFSRHSASSRFTRGTSLGPSYANAV